MPPKLGQINSRIKKKKRENAKVATLTSSHPLAQNIFKYSTCRGAPSETEETGAPGTLPCQPLLFAHHAFSWPPLVAENARMRPPFCLVGTLMMVLFLSCLRPESFPAWDPCVEVCVLISSFPASLPCLSKLPQLRASCCTFRFVYFAQRS